ncbi:MAG: sulfatase-like hydrolase/transferase [Acidobacteriota bacterium]
MRIVISLLLSVALFGCGQTQPSQPELEAALEARLIDTEPVDYFNAASVVATETVQAWAFPESVATWTIDGASAVETTDRGWSIRSTSDHPSTISLETTMAPASIDLVSVEASGIGRGTLRLSWAGAGESFDEQRQVEVGIGTVVRGEIRRYHLKLPIRDQPSITRLRLDLALERNAKVMLESIVAGRRVVDESKLAMTIGQAWKVPLGDDMRNAWVTLPGLVRESTVAVPEDGARLYVGYGRQPDIEVPTTFRIFASSAQTSEDEPLFESTLDKTGEGRWHRAVIDLSAYAGSELTLRFETDSPTMLDPRVGFLAWAHPELRKAGVVGKANLLLVSIDTLRAENLSVYGYERPTSPNLERWAAEHATVFETTVASAPWTLPAHVSMFSGLDAHHHGVNHGSPAPNDLIMLAEVLRASGWTTAAITGGGYVHPQWGFAQGFDSYRSFGEKMGFADELDHNLEQALAWLDEHQDQRFFLFFHTYEVHNPYRAREPYFSELSDLDPKGWFLRTNRERLGADQGYLDTRSWTLLRRGKVHGDGSLPPELESLPYDLYDSGIAYTDAAMGRLLGHLDALGVADQTVVVVTADHGEMLGEHGLVNHLYLYDENLLVPLMIADPTGRGAGGRVSTQVSSVDIVPTVLDLLDLDAPAGLDGRSLAPALDGDPLEGSDEAWSYAAASNYGLGWMLYPPAGVVWHSGANPGFSAQLSMRPEQGDAFIYMTNGGSGSGFGVTSDIGYDLALDFLGLEDAPRSGDQTPLKIAFIVMAIAPFGFVLGAVRVWRRRDQIAQHSLARRWMVTGLCCVFAAAIAWALLVYVPVIFFTPLDGIALFVPDWELLIRAVAYSAIAWALVRIGVSIVAQKTARSI